MPGQPVPIIVCDRIKTEMQVAKVCALCLHVRFCWQHPQCNYGHGWPAMTAHLLASQLESGAPCTRLMSRRYTQIKNHIQ